MDEVPSCEFTWVVFVHRWAETTCLLTVQGLWNEQTDLFSTISTLSGKVLSYSFRFIALLMEVCLQCSLLYNFSLLVRFVLSALSGCMIPRMSPMADWRSLSGVLLGADPETEVLPAAEEVQPVEPAIEATEESPRSPAHEAADDDTASTASSMVSDLLSEADASFTLMDELGFTPHTQCPPHLVDILSLIHI